jgi:hypothetical protein
MYILQLKRLSKRLWLKCYTDDEIISNEFSSEKLTTNAIENSGLRKYRIAIACTGEYSQYQGGTKDHFLIDIETKDGNWLPSEKISINGGFNSLENSKSNNSNFNVYPKVADEYIEISFDGIDLNSTEILIFDFSGRLIFDNSLKSSKKRIDICKYNSGLYFIVVKDVSAIHFDKLYKLF